MKQKIIVTVCFLIFIAGNLQALAANNDEKILGTTSIIKAVLTQQLISDYPGDFRGYVTHDAYDTTHEYVLIPKGSVIHGSVLSMANVNEAINSRVGYIIHSITRPDDTVIDMSSDSAVDHEGVSGIEDEVDRHLMAQFLGVTAYALIGTQAGGKQTGGVSGNFDFGAEVKRGELEQLQPMAAKVFKSGPNSHNKKWSNLQYFHCTAQKNNTFQGYF